MQDVCVAALIRAKRQKQMISFNPLSADHRKWRSRREGDDSVVLASQLQGCRNIGNKCPIC